MNLLKKIYINEVELYGEKDIYYYFNLINEKFENKIFSSSDIEGTIMSTESLTYKIRSNVFPNNADQIPAIFKTSIKVILRKKGDGTTFNIYPKTGIHTWIYIALTIGIILRLTGDTLLKQPADIISYLFVITIFYLLDRFAKRSLISDFKEQVLYR